MTVNHEEFFKNKKQPTKLGLLSAITNSSDRKTYAILLAGLSLIAPLFILILYKFNFPISRLRYITDKIIQITLEKQSEYLFFLGTFIISLLLANNNRRILAKTILIIGCGWVAFHDSITNWLYSLGVDSFSEVHNFAWSEAWFYIQTMHNIIHADFSVKHIVLFIMYVIAGIIMFWSLRSVRIRYGFAPKRFSYIKLFIGVLLIVVSLNLVFSTAIKKFNNSVNLFNITAANFQNTPPALSFNNTGIKVVVYIGESTSIMNMGLYGYPRNTTPHLDKLYQTDQNFLRFKNVFSTHTHTSQSLLEALSVNADNNNDLLPINLRKRISLIDMLNNGKVGSYLYSNQGSTGTWNLAASIIFKNAYKKFSTTSVIAGNADNQLEKPSDDEFFEQNLIPSLHSLDANKSAVIFLHSYAGHGEYLNNIPASFRQPVDGYINSRPTTAVVGSNTKLTKEVEAYDSAIKYVDFSVAKTIGQIKTIDQPIALIYFSDHGDSAYSASGHDSSRFIHEMARVPFIIYFNEKARKIYPQLFDKYKALSEKNNISTLAQLPSTIIDILGGDIKNPMFHLPDINGSYSNKGIQPLIIRETTFGGSYIDLNQISSSEHKDKYANVNDNATNIFVAANTYKNSQTKLCYGNANTIGKALRGALITGCLELDIPANNPSKDEQVQADIKDIGEIAQKNRLTLWLNIKTPDACEKLTDTLNSIDNNILAEFPGGMNLEDSRWLACIDSIHKLKGSVAYSVPSDKLSACAQAIKSKLNPAIDSNCQALETDLKNAVTSRLFTDFSFDGAGISAMKNSPAANKLSWNIRNVEAQVFNDIEQERFNRVAINNTDPNNLD